MNYASSNPYRDFGMAAAQAPANERATFIRATYAHLLGAVIAFIGIEYALFATGTAERMLDYISHQGGLGMVMILVGFMAVTWLANGWANSSASRGMQYGGLALYVVAEAFLFAPILYIAVNMGQPDILPTAAIITGIVFLGLTAVVFVSGADFSFLRGALAIGGLAAIGTVVCAMIFGWDLGVFFSGAMILLASGYILYDTSNVLHHYRVDQYVAASLALFASVALLFYYVLRLLMELNRRD
jgi:FtsH-binding integral membrane protein